MKSVLAGGRRGSHISDEQRALIAVFSAAGRMRRRMGLVLEQHQISASQYNVLRILRGAGGVLATMTIRDRMMDREPSITRLVDRLKAKGQVRRVPSREDRRRVDCHLTSAGRKLLDSLDEPIDEMDRELMQGLTKRELQTVVELLEKVGSPGE